MDSLGITAVIATVLSMIFAAAALWNSIARRRHEAAMALRNEPEAEKFSFKPMPSTPAATRHPNASRHAGSHPQSPAKKADPPAESTAPLLFRQIRATGDIEEEHYPEDEDMYVWE